ncbi:hypothetical protein ISG33_11190 [Glaciecola sp. MH2013]|uniref:hypothetical protein n=1 Tax=Glaciecola sp. MH2013 TaxID=2785524 RepID=UPI00189F589B|nr:hypothetical protein [Glaciecola sp. MH2013]MBF7073964.1 hypothetical protein [Glaciecola sp. MH2013]
MAKYLQQCDLGASNLYEHNDMFRFNIEARPIVESLNKQLKRNVLCKFGKLVIKIVPLSHSTTAYFADDGDVCVKNVPYDIKRYIDATPAKKHEIMFELLKDLFDNPGPDVELDSTLLHEFLNDFKAAGYKYMFETKKRVVNSSKTKGARLLLEYDLTALNVYALISGKKASPTEKLLMGSYPNTSVDALYVTRHKNVLQFIDDNTLGFAKNKDCDCVFTLKLN